MDLLPGEYHPYAACIIYQNATSERQVRAALREVMQWARSHSYRHDKNTGAVVERLR